MRIVAGTLRGRKLLDSTKLDLRPTTDRNREALFNILSTNKFGFKLQNARILDLCCGTGAVGFEALSRGASFVTFIDNNQKHLNLVKENAKNLDVVNNVQILNCDANKLPSNLFSSNNFDLIFIDPPYENDYLKIIQQFKIFNINALIVIEFPKAIENTETLSSELTLLDLRTYGKSSFGFFKRFAII